MRRKIAQWLLIGLTLNLYWGVQRIVINDIQKIRIGWSLRTIVMCYVRAIDLLSQLRDTAMPRARKALVIVLRVGFIPLSILLT